VTIALPMKYRQQVMSIAHDKDGHLANKKILAVIRKKFRWPFMAADVARYCSSSKCQFNTRAGPRKAPMVQTEIVVVPFEKVAIDLVGPFEYILTYICMASKWPEAVPFKSMTATAVAESLVTIISRKAYLTLC